MCKTTIKRIVSRFDLAKQYGVNIEYIYEMMDKVFDERIRQNKKFGEQDHYLTSWMTILGEEYGEACKAALDTFNFKTTEEYREKLIPAYEEEIIQIIAVCFAILENIKHDKDE